jgi:CubicO group peptidase (beta-lactamase class C family)
MPNAVALGLIAVLLPAAAAANPVPRERVEAALSEMTAMAERLTETGAVPGLAIAVVHDDEVVHLGGFGLRETGKPGTVDADTVFQIASMSKPLSATVVASLVTEELVDWDSRMAEINPRFRLHDAYPAAEVTLRDLFSHRSGLPGTSGDDLEAIGFDRETIMQRLALVPPSSSFRAGYAYSNAGLTQAGLAAAMAAGGDWETVAEERLFGPLGMASTSARYSDFLEHENRAELHINAGGAWEARVRRDPDEQAPAGGVSSTARDLAEWMRLELGRGQYDGEQIIAADAIGTTHAPLISRGNHPLTGAPTFYGLGWNLEYGRHGTSWGHAGAFSTGARTVVTLYPDSGLGIVVLCNAFPTGVPEAIADSFFDLVFDGTVSRDWVAGWDGAYAGLFGPAIAAARAAYAAPPEPATPALPDAAYLGTYASAYAGDAVVAAEAGGLVLKLGPGGKTVFPLRHFDRDLFLYGADPELPDLPSALSFAVGPDGRAGALTAESLDSNGLGTFVRVE